MARFFRFARMLARHSSPYTLISQPPVDPDDAYNDDGVAVAPTPTVTVLRGSIQPLSTRWLQLDGGKYTEDDRALYTLATHQNGDVIRYQGRTYKVDGEEDRPDYTDFNKYLLKWVSTP